MIKHNFIDKMQPTWASRHILGNNLFVAANTWSQMVTYVYTSLHLALGALLPPDFRTLDHMLPTSILFQYTGIFQENRCWQRHLVTAGHRSFCLFTAGPKSTFTARPSCLDQVLAIWASKQMFCKNLDEVSNTWSQLAAGASCFFLLLAWRALAIKDLTFHDKTWLAWGSKKVTNMMFKTWRIPLR